MCFTQHNILSSATMAPRRNFHLILQTKRRRRQIAYRKLKVFALYMLWQMNQVHREFWIHPLNVERSQKGEFYTHYADHRHYPERFFQLYRMNVMKFDELLHKVTPYLRKKELNLRETISVEQRLVITLR